MNDLVYYRYLGEEDCPSIMLYNFATIKDVERCGGQKLDWFICSNGQFFVCDSITADMIFDSGRLVEDEFSFEIEREELYDSLSEDEKIAFRMNLQGLSEEQSKKIVLQEKLWDENSTSWKLQQ